MSTSALLAPTRPLPVWEPGVWDVTPLAARTWRLRVFSMRDYEQVMALWLKTGISIGPTDSRQGILQTLQRNPDLFLVADNGQRVVGTVIGTYDGRCGWAHHVAVDPQWQRAGVGAALMGELEKRLRARGCATLNLTVRRTNAQVQGFYERLGFEPRDVICMQKSLLD
jgi:ribosomal protein S18 acetylase RimI-like enzyme